MTDATTIVPNDAPEGEKRPRVTRRGGLFVNDAELIERLGVPEKEARKVLEAGAAGAVWKSGERVIQVDIVRRD